MCKDNGKGQYSRVETVEVTGEYEVTVTMSLPDILFLSNIATDPCGLIISKEAYEKNGPEWCEKNPVGTGPFRFVSWENDVEVVYTRNENYRGVDEEGNQLPNLRYTVGKQQIVHKNHPRGKLVFVGPFRKRWKNTVGEAFMPPGGETFRFSLRFGENVPCAREA